MRLPDSLLNIDIDAQQEAGLRRILSKLGAGATRAPSPPPAPSAPGVPAARLDAFLARSNASTVGDIASGICTLRLGDSEPSYRRQRDGSWVVADPHPVKRTAAPSTTKATASAAKTSAPKLPPKSVKAKTAAEQVAALPPHMRPAAREALGIVERDDDLSAEERLQRASERAAAWNMAHAKPKAQPAKSAPKPKSSAGPDLSELAMASVAGPDLDVIATLGHVVPAPPEEQPELPAAPMATDDLTRLALDAVDTAPDTLTDLTALAMSDEPEPFPPAA